MILTNGIVWRLYHVVFAKPIDKRLICELDLLSIDPRREADQEQLYLFTKEGFEKGAPAALRDRQDATSRYLLASLLLNNQSVIATIRRELRRVVDVLVDDSDIERVLRNEVIKRDTLEGPAAELAGQRVMKLEARPLRTARPHEEGEAEVSDGSAPAAPVQVSVSAEPAKCPVPDNVPASGGLHLQI